jgi:Ca2+-binding RTX toxin-like protein
VLLYRSAPERDRRSVLRKTVLLVAAVALALSLAAGVALAQTPRFGDQGPGVSKTCSRDCDGTTYPDTLKGTDAPNHIEGLGGNEKPTFGDYITGHGGNDILYGDAGGDRIEGGRSADSIFGGSGKDVLIGGKGEDSVDGGTGGDSIMVKDGQRDVVNCRGGTDTVVRDSIDRLRNC